MKKLLILFVFALGVSGTSFAIEPVGTGSVPCVTQRVSVQAYSYNSKTGVTTFYGSYLYFMNVADANTYILEKYPPIYGPQIIYYGAEIICIS